MTEATCQICRRYRPLMADKRVCFPCSVGTSHTCPICQDIVPGGGRAPCYRCSQLRRAKIQIATEAATIPHPWLADLFKTYCTSSDLSLDDGKTNGRITRAAAACRRIATTVTNPGDLTTDALHAALGAESLRRVAPLIAYWTEIGVLDWDRARLQTLIERDRIAVILKTHQDAPHAALLQSYRDHLAIRDRKPITQRTALTSALALLETLGDAPLAHLTDRHLARTLRKRPGHRASLQGFLRFIAAQGGPDLRPRTPFRRDPIAQERALRAEISLLRKRLEKPRSVAEARALLALLISRLYALPLPRVLALRSKDVVVERVRLTLWPEADAIDIDKPLADKFRQWIAWSPMWKSLSRPWVFPGRHGHQPLSEAAVAYHLAEKAKDLPRNS